MPRDAESLGVAREPGDPGPVVGARLVGLLPDGTEEGGGGRRGCRCGGSRCHPIRVTPRVTIRPPEFHDAMIHANTPAPTRTSPTKPKRMHSADPSDPTSSALRP